MMQQELGHLAENTIMISAATTDGGSNMKNAAKEFAGDIISRDIA
jgi:hypothetical protein